MKILFTGKSDFTYNRVRVLLEGLKNIDGVELLFYPIKQRSSFKKNEFAAIQAKADFIYIPPFRHVDVRFIKKLSTKPIVFDPLISKLLTKAVDYGHFWKAPIKYYLDKAAFSNCDVLIADTQVHKKYYCDKFGIRPENVGVVPVGVNTVKFFPIHHTTKRKFIVGTYASFVPLQGMPIIIRACELLKNHVDIEFQIIGDGYEFKRVKQYAEKHSLHNVKFLGRLKYEALNIAINRFDLCLGIFGHSQKADSVIPNKIFHYAALKKCILTKNTPAIQELFTHGKDILLCENTPEQVAHNIRSLYHNTALRNRLADNGFKAISTNYDHIQIARTFIHVLENWRKNR